MSKPNKHQVVDRLYKEKLKEIEKYYTGDRTTYLKELEGAGKKLLGVKFKGVYPSDKIPKLNDLSPYCVLNLDSSKEPGSHWVALAKNGDVSILYDSFGRHNNEIIPDLKFSGNGRIIDTDRDVEQKVLETNCGARSLAFLCIFDKYGANIAKMI